jgi:hypothetical protein
MNHSLFTQSGFSRPPLIVILGHYGSGKTNLALNIAKYYSKYKRTPLLIDLDVVNPYYRSTDFAEFAQEQGVELTGPIFGASNLDAPSLAPGIDSRILEASSEPPVIIDVGGDPDGARALARFATAVQAKPDALVLYVVNFRRPETATVEQNLQLIAELEQSSHLSVTALIGNTHLQDDTDATLIETSFAPLQELAEQSNLPIAAIAVTDELVAELEGASPPAPLLPISRIVKNSWEG